MITDPAVINRLWDLYVDAYLTMRDQAVSREMLHRSEFEHEMTSPDTRVFVVWDGPRPVAMAAIATDLANNDWVNEAFLARRFPEAHARGAVHYCMFLLVHPEYWGTRALALLSRTGFAAEAADGAVIVFDVPEVNQPTEAMGLANVMARLGQGVADVEMVPLEVRRYYGLVLSHAKSPTIDLTPAVDLTDSTAARVGALGA